MKLVDSRVVGTRLNIKAASHGACVGASRRSVGTERREMAYTGATVPVPHGRRRRAEPRDVSTRLNEEIRLICVAVTFKGIFELVASLTFHLKLPWQ